MAYNPMTLARLLMVGSAVKRNFTDQSPNTWAKTDYAGRASTGNRLMNAATKWPVNSSLSAFDDERAGRVTTVPKNK